MPSMPPRLPDDMIKSLGVTAISNDQVSPPSKEIHERIDIFLKSSVKGDWPYFLYDEIYMKLREQVIVT
jgi:transposase-like protein